jgi:hypothetical protein
MPISRNMLRGFALSALLIATTMGVHAQAIPVEVKQEADGTWQLYRGGEPYYIKGAGGTGNMESLVAAGGNSIRTWSIADAKEILDEAHELGLTVMVGLWMGQERQGFDYTDPWAVEDQLRSFRDQIMEIKDHPAILCYGVGNEVDLFYTDFNVWDAAEDICAMIHEVDPLHPTSVVTAGIDVAEIQMIQERAPSVDILGFNTYGDVKIVSRVVDQSGYTGPYMVTEWGTDGHWEVPKTDWGVPIERTGTQKENDYRDRFDEYIWSDRQQCIGSYVFLWGQKQETTPTWYGVFLEDGTATARVDGMSDAWGAPPANRAPKIDRYLLNGVDPYASLRVKPGEWVDIDLAVRDPEGKGVDLKWELLPESTDIRSGGDFETRPQAMNLKLEQSESGGKRFRAPRGRGSYRLFIYVRDDSGKAVSANFPFLVE